MKIKKTVMAKDRKDIPYATYYLDEMKNGSFQISEDDHLLKTFDDLEDAKKYFKEELCLV